MATAVVTRDNSRITSRLSNVLRFALIYAILSAMEKTRPIFYGVVDNAEEV